MPSYCLALPPTPRPKKLAAHCGSRGASNGDSSAVSVGRRAPEAVPRTPSLYLIAASPGAAAQECECPWREDCLVPSFAVSME